MISALQAHARQAVVQLTSAHFRARQILQNGDVNVELLCETTRRRDHLGVILERAV